MEIVELTLHPDSAPRSPGRVSVELAWRREAGELGLRFRLAGDTEGVLLPAATTPRRTDGLWQHTCCEAFIGPAGGDDYAEFNFSPSSEWAAYRFAGRRSGMQRLEGIAPPSVHAVARPGEIAVSAVLGLAGMAPFAKQQPLRIGLAAVVEQRDGRRAYWALRHPPGPPDFHHPIAFSLSLDMAGGDFQLQEST